MKSERIFGTDGIRGRAGEGWLAPRAVASLGVALGEVLGPAAMKRAQSNDSKSGATKSSAAKSSAEKSNTEKSNAEKSRDSKQGGAPRALLAHDGRRSGPELEAALARGLASQGFSVASAGLITTPGLALLTRLEGFQLGAMISASHNPAEDNGIKVFSGDGDKLSDELEIAIEERLRARPAIDLSGPTPTLEPEHEARYLDYLVEKAGSGLRLDGMTIALDCANGGGSRVAPRVFGRLGAHVLAIAAEPDGDNINRNCGATSLGLLQQEVRSQRPALGIALDGDGDRCMLVDEKGDIVHGDGIMTLLAREAVRKNKLDDKRIVATVMSNRGLHRALRDVGVTVVTTDVGDRRVVEALRREHLSLGGEQSGHIVFGPDNHYIGDGIYTALRVLRVLQDTKRPLSELAGAYRAFPQVLLNVTVARKPNLDAIPSVVAAKQRVENELGEDGRVLLRYSGTESLARVMVEGPDLERIRGQAQELASLISAEIGV